MSDDDDSDSIVTTVPKKGTFGLDGIKVVPGQSNRFDINDVEAAEEQRLLDAKAFDDIVDNMSARLIPPPLSYIN